MDLASMFALAKKINIYNSKLQKLLPPPLNQLRLVQIIDNQAIFIAKNQALLTRGKQQQDIIFDCLTINLGLKIIKIKIKLNHPI